MFKSKPESAEIHMSTTNTTSDTKTELLDALLHTNLKRIAVAKLCAFAASLIMLMVTSFIQIGTAGKLWWLQLMASMVYGGKAFLVDASSTVYIVGFVIHIFFAGMCGFMVGKRTRLAIFMSFTLSLGFLMSVVGKVLKV
ncbi:MAG: hypothetical protein IPM57_05785 [Oligoflexia bacterium]|nr:hypothetical protein [Oligoflexia bacterium]